ncbi:chymotrypsin-1 [Orussus abietinus]|uniref:chymotrypsin-1 n=1 Tax=Orussus abietinus TaxID=222816 RepID=UPI000626A697|nr:chymotrypsin-1 [Orussus abietinus]
MSRQTNKIFSITSSTCLALALAVAAEGTSRGPPTRLIGGISADIGEFPYQASLRLKGGHFCGGSIITTRHVLTAAHCIIDFLSTGSDLTGLTVVTGTNSLARGGTTHAVGKYSYHKDYAGGPSNMWRNDVAVLTLAKEIEVTTEQSPISLPDEDVPWGETGVVSGWGLTVYPGNSFPTILQKSNVTFIQQSECSRHHPGIITSQICAMQKYGVGTCNGDSGGPLVYGDTVVGIVSWGRNCALGVPDVYTKVYSHREYIRQIVDRI